MFERIARIRIHKSTDRHFVPLVLIELCMFQSFITGNNRLGANNTNFQ